MLRPDGPIRKARHFLNHLLFSGKETIILDPSLDDAASPQPRLGMDLLNENIEQLTLEFSATSPRDHRQLDGNKLTKGIKAQYSPINPSSISIPLDIQLQRERERRQPDIVDDNQYLP